MADPTTLNDDMHEEYDFSRATRGNPYQHLVKRPVKIETADGCAHPAGWAGSAPIPKDRQG